MASSTSEDGMIILEEHKTYRRDLERYRYDRDFKYAFWTKYLFFLKAPDFLKKEGVDLSYVMDRSWAPVEQAMTLIKSTLFGFKGVDDYALDENIQRMLEEENIVYGEVKMPTNDTERVEWFTAYLLSRMLISAYPDEVIINHYVRNLARYIYKRIDDEALPFDVSVILDEMGIKHRTKLPEYVTSWIDGMKEKTSAIIISVDWRDYLRYGGKFVQSRNMKLVNRKITGGMVEMTYKEAVRLMQEFITHRIAQNLPAPVSSSFLETYAEEIDELKKIAGIISISSMEITAGIDQIMPPCIRTVGQRMASGINATHAERIAYATYLINTGMQEDAILDRFRNTPDFREKIARYQIEHLMGIRGGRRYSVPSCKWLKGNGICHPDVLCNKGKVLHPLIYTKLMKTLLDALEKAGVSPDTPVEEILNVLKEDKNISSERDFQDLLNGNTGMKIIAMAMERLPAYMEENKKRGKKERKEKKEG